MNKKVATRAMAILAHYEVSWGMPERVVPIKGGRIDELGSDFSVIEFAPHGEVNYWRYATSGMSREGDETGIELHILFPRQNASAAELLAMTAHFHRTAARLDVGHTVNFGRPWLGESRCEYGLISFSHLEEPEFDRLLLSNGEEIDFAWLIPVTHSEVMFKKCHGLELLEKAFEDADFNFIDPMRESVI